MSMRSRSPEFYFILLLSIFALVFIAKVSFSQPTTSTISPRAFGSKSWRENGLSPLSLPLTGNLLWDVRLASDGALYYWDGAESGWVPIIAEGSVGPQGEPGEQGPQGIQGIQGVQGIQGAQGPTGADGAAGLNGLDGADGAIGPPGPIAGSDTQIIFNDAGAATGDADLTFNKTTNKLTSGLHQVTLSGDGQVFQAGGATSSFPGLYRAGPRLDVNLANDGGMGTLGAQEILGGSNHSMVSNTPSFRINSNGGGLFEVTSLGGIEWSSSNSDARANEDTKIMRGAAGVVKFTDALSFTPLASPPVTCGSPGSESTVYYDTSHAYCVCGTSTWHNLTPSDGGSCS